MKILYIDDKPEIRTLLGRYLEKWGYDAIGAPDGETGWRLLREHACDIVITDWIMPDLDGPSLCRRIRDIGFPWYVYIIMLTARKDDVVLGMESGADDFIAKPFNKEELKVRLKAAERIIRLERELEQANRMLLDQNRMLQASEERLQRMAHYDKLTGLPNRVLFFDRLERAILEASRHRSGFGLLFIDLDAFKAANDIFGHETGDGLLKGVSDRLVTCVRESDTVARLGGDEFCVIVRETPGINDAVTVAKKIIAAMSLPFDVAGNICRIGASVGIALYPEDGGTLELLLNHADAAMYAAKKNGTNTWHHWQQSMTGGGTGHHEKR